MSIRILIDADHVGETRLVVCNDEEISEIDYQLSEKRRHKGNIYLGRVDRIEPALQAAFVDYGGNKCGFLPLSEINMSYYTGSNSRNDWSANGNGISKEPLRDNAEEAEEVIAKKRRSEVYSRYNIQDFLKKDQEILVQVVNEERGNKGVTLTTDISLYGRYIVFMPNSNRNNGVSKRIFELDERARLLKVVEDISKDNAGARDSILVRSSAIYKTKIEIRKDLSYLQSLWQNIRQEARKSAAPAFIHEEGNIIIRAIRDLYHSDVEEIVIAGKSAYDTACDFAELMIPRHVDKIKLYEGRAGIFSNYNIEKQVAGLYSNTVMLPSGGAIVINQTEALVSIDINSGRVAGTRNIEETATKTNIAATKEIAKQLKLRDLAGLIVIDFIDMENHKNVESVEKALAQELSSDRARFKIGRISEFGLLEMSRQRLRNNVLEASTIPCDYCGGRGKVRMISATSNAILRAISFDLMSSNPGQMIEVSGRSELIMHILNEKRAELSELEAAFNAKIILSVDVSASYDSFFIDIKEQNNTKKSIANSDVSNVLRDGYGRNIAESGADLDSRTNYIRSNRKQTIQKKKEVDRSEQKHEKNNEQIDKVNDKKSDRKPNGQYAKRHNNNDEGHLEALKNGDDAKEHKAKKWHKPKSSQKPGEKTSNSNDTNVDNKNSNRENSQASNIAAKNNSRRNSRSMKSTPKPKEDTSFLRKLWGKVLE